ncbi:MAG: prolyl oligopeptidase family serine peptidase, partial [Pseudomonadota bacterium]
MRVLKDVVATLQAVATGQMPAVRGKALLRGAACIALALAPLNATAEDAMDDPYIWLEEITGEKSLAWVNEQNARSKPRLETAEFDAMFDEAKAILTSTARIPNGQIHNGKVYNFWQDATNVRGLWRRASVESFKAGKPVWETVLDYDALAKREGRNWVRGSVECLSPDYVHCMVEISDGGTDAGYWREFNTETKSFVDGGFSLPEGKQIVSWLDKDTLLVGYDRGDGSLTASGYPRTSVLWRRGQPLAEAKEVFAGEETDVSAGALAEQDTSGPFVFGYRSPSFFERVYSLRNEKGAFEQLPWPRQMSFVGTLDGEAIIALREAYSPTDNGPSYKSGDIVAYDLSTGATSLVFSPNERQSVGNVGIGKSGLIIQYLDDVIGKAARVTRNADTENWEATDITLPPNGVVSIVSAGGGTDDAVFSFESLTSPDTLYFSEGGTNKKAVTEIMQLPAFYDASDVVVEQRFATSSDGTKVPYFIMGKSSVLEQGNAPTIQYGYGGFLASILPVYYTDPSRPQHGALAGKVWVSRGGVLVLSNTRGGAEYGPGWHAAALKENRQLAFDDFIAISEHLIETGVTSSEKLGAVGRSNGGLLMGAIMTQRPDLYAAVNIGVPLFDMLRYHKLLAGASWIGEYGNPDIPEERAYIEKYSPYQQLSEG